MFTSLDHLVIAVRDLDVATTTYATLLGRAPSWRGDHPGAGTANALFRLGNTYVELLSPVGSGVLGDALVAQLERDGEGPYALAFGTPDAAACAASTLGTRHEMPQKRSFAPASRAPSSDAASSTVMPAMRKKRSRTRRSSNVRSSARRSARRSR